MFNQLENKILIVDDEPIMLLMLEQILGKEGCFQLKTADSASAALAIMDSFSPDIILLDIQMAGMDGYELCRQIRAAKSSRFIKIIMVSGCSQVSKRLKAYEAGADDYVVKPFDEQELLAKIRVYQRLKNKEEVDQVKGDLLTLLTHETRTPLNGIIGCSEILLADKSLGQEQRDLVTMILAAGQELFQFQENAMLLSKLRAGVDLNCSFASLADAFTAALNTCQPIIDDRQIEVEKELEKDLVLWVDWQLFQQAVEFVVDNGVKYSPACGRLTLRGYSQTGVCFIEVEDEGPGVAPDRGQKIFEEFSIVDVAHHQQGQGLSLAITHRILTCHGGSIHVEKGKGGKGACFVMEIPMVKTFQPGMGMEVVGS